MKRPGFISICGQVAVILAPWLPAIVLWRDNYLCAERFNALDEPVCIVPPVRNDGFGPAGGKQPLGLRHVRTLPRCQYEADQIAKCIDGHM